MTNVPGLEWEYDREQDVLYCVIGRPVPALSETDQNDESITWRYAFEDGRLTGFTVWAYSEHARNALQRYLEAEWHRRGGTASLPSLP